MTIDADANTGSIDKGANGTDTFTDVSTPITIAGNGSLGGLAILGTAFSDTYNLTVG